MASNLVGSLHFIGFGEMDCHCGTTYTPILSFSDKLLSGIHETVELSLPDIDIVLQSTRTYTLQQPIGLV
jgi:hypothetical protein